MMSLMLQEEKTWLLSRDPSVAWANMIKLPWGKPGEQAPPGSCCRDIITRWEEEG